ncbi:ATP-binding protein [Streptomyces sp. NPDC059373]
MKTMQDDVDGGRLLGSEEGGFGDSQAAVCEARLFAMEILARWGIADRAEDLRLCVSELSTNALVHATPPAGGFTLRVLAWARLLRVEVEDQGTGMPVRRAARLEDVSGRGLLLVEALSDDWGVVEGEYGKTVWCEFRLKPESDAGWSMAAVAC